MRLRRLRVVGRDRQEELGLEKKMAEKKIKSKTSRGRKPSGFGLRDDDRKLLYAMGWVFGTVFLTWLFVLLVRGQRP